MGRLRTNPPLLALKLARKVPAVDNRGHCVESGDQVQAAVTDPIPDIYHFKKIRQKTKDFPTDQVVSFNIRTFGVR